MQAAGVGDLVEVEQVAEGLGQQGWAIGEVPVDGAAGHAAALGHRVDGEAPEALLGEEGGGGLEHQAARALDAGVDGGRGHWEISSSRSSAEAIGSLGQARLTITAATAPMIAATVKARLMPSA